MKFFEISWLENGSLFIFKQLLVFIMQSSTWLTMIIEIEFSSTR